MSDIHKAVGVKLEDLEREICELKARLDNESGQRALADEHISSRIDELSALIASRCAP